MANVKRWTSTLGDGLLTFKLSAWKHFPALAGCGKSLFHGPREVHRLVIPHGELTDAWRGPAAVEAVQLRLRRATHSRDESDPDHPAAGGPRAARPVARS